MKVPTIAYLPFYILGITMAFLDHTTAIVMTISWGLTTIILNHVINLDTKDVKCTKDEAGDKN